MAELQALADRAVAAVLAASWQLPVLIACVLVLQRVLRDTLSPRWRYALWCIVVARLALPVQPQVEVGALDWSLPERELATTLQERTPVRRSVRNAERRTQQDRTAASVQADERADEPAPAPAVRRGPALARVPAGLSDMQASPTVPASLTDHGASVAAAANGTAPEASTATATEDTPEANAVTGTLWFTVLWWGVALALLLRDLARELRFRRALRSEPRVSDASVHAELDACRALVGVRRPVELVRTELVGSPATAGWLRPRILLPRSVAVDLPREQLRHVLLHELAHVKRGDGLLELGLLVLRRLYWFHPLVPFALARLRAAQENARDFEALSLRQGPAPIEYARTLVHLVETSTSTRPPAATVGFLHARSELQRRVLMIANYRPRTHRSTACGALIVAALGWTAFTTASTAPAAPELVPPSQTARDGLLTVRVERPSEEPAWRTELKRSLERPLDVAFERDRLEDVLAHVRGESGLNLVVDPELLDAYADEPLSLETKGTTVRQVLGLVARLVPELGWCLSRRAVYVTFDHALPHELELRLYNIAPLLEPDNDVDEVISLVQELSSDQEAFERDGVSIEFWRGLLVVMNTDEVHAEVEANLNRLLNRGRRPAREMPGWERGLRAALDTRVSLDVEEQRLRDVLAGLARDADVAIVVSPEYGGEEVTLELTDVDLRTALEWICTQTGLHASFADGALVVGERAQLDAEFYPVGDLVHSHPDVRDWEEADGLEHMIRDNILPDSWDEDPRALIYFWRDLLVVQQSPPVLDQVDRLIAAVRRASDN